MAGTTGLEPAASAVTGQRSNQLNYVPALAASVKASVRVFSHPDSAFSSTVLIRLRARFSLAEPCRLRVPALEANKALSLRHPICVLERDVHAA
jgi:hypothetical protein